MQTENFTFTKSKNTKNAHFWLFFISIITCLILQLFVTASAQAECTREGQTYKTGDTVGPYICMPNGTWQQK